MEIEQQVKNSDTNGFKAFVSYSHADKLAAQRLHRKLESYRLPKHLRGSVSGIASDGRVGAIFRDREDLPAAEDLTESVKLALSRSEALVVLCSPDAQKSPWVAREIELFRELHPDRPVLAALLRGEPEEAFPPALRDGREPLAADLRKDGDGPRLGFLKVIAGIANVPLDTLVNRDAQRRVRRVTAITVTALAATLVMAAMTIFALQSRNEAQRQRDGAEGLVEYMLTDLRTELRGVGRLDVMTGVNDRAFAFYEAQGDLSQLAADSLERRARVLHAMGEDEWRLGKSESAVANFKEAHRATAELISREPQNPDRVYTHAQSEFWVGYASWGTDIEAVGEAWSGYLRLARRLEEIEPNSPRSMMELGYAHGNMCELRVEQGKLNNAISQCRMAIEYAEKASAMQPEDASKSLALANRRGWMADTLMQAKRFEEAANERLAERELLRELMQADPENEEYKLRGTWPDIGIADIRFRQGNAQDAYELLHAVNSRLIALQKHDSKNGEIAITRMRTLLLRAKAGRQMGAANWEGNLQAARNLANDFGGHDASAQLTELIEESNRGE